MVVPCLSARFRSRRVSWRKYFYAWRVSLFLIGVVVSNRFANYTITGVYTGFLTSEWDTGIYAAAMVINLKEALTSLFSIFGATYATHATAGRYHAVRFSLLPSIIGLGLFTVAALKKLPMGVRITLFSLSLLFTAMGEGMQKHTIFILGYDQFKYQMDDEEKAKRQAHIWWGAGRFVGTASGLIVSSLLIEFLPTESMTWWVFGGILSSGLTLLTSIIYILGKLSLYRNRIAGKSPIVDVLKVVVAAIRKRHLPYATDACFIYAEERMLRNPRTDPLQQMRSTTQENIGNMAEMPQAIKTIEGADQVVTEDQSNKFEKQELAGVHEYSHIHKLRWLEKASIIESPALTDIHVKQWKLCPLNKVKDTKMVFGLLPLWSTFLMFQVVKAMGDTFFLEQADALERPSIFGVDITLAVVLAVQSGSQLLITQLLSCLKRVPKLKDGFPSLFRIGIGLFISIFCCIVAGIVEHQRLSKVVPGKEITPMSIFWLVPQCFLLGAAIGFAEEGISDFFDERVPPNLRVCYRLTSESVNGVGFLINSIILAAIHLFSTLGVWKRIGKKLNTSKLHIVYFIIAGMSTINLLLYFLVSRKYSRSKEDDQQPFLPADNIPKEDQSQLPTRDDEQQNDPNDVDPGPVQQIS